MTDKDMEIQELRRRVKFLEQRNKELEQIHQLDISEIVRMRRQVDSLTEVGDAKDQPAP